MTKIIQLACALILTATSMPAYAGPTAQTASNHEVMLEKKSGFLTCTGGTQAPLFKQDCKALTMERVSFGGNFTYEAQCEDSSGTVYIVVCLAFSFEPDQSASGHSSILR